MRLDQKRRGDVRLRQPGAAERELRRTALPALDLNPERLRLEGQGPPRAEGAPADEGGEDDGRLGGRLHRLLVPALRRSIAR